MNQFGLTATYTDLYQLTMGQVYFLNGQREADAAFDYFFRKLPFGGGYVVFAGLHDLLQVLENLQFSSDDLDYLQSIGMHREFVRLLRDFRFRGDIYSVPEGDIIFPTRPVLRVEGNVIEAQLIETLLLNILNFESLIATKASRMRLVAGDRLLADFGLRRAQGLGGYHASRAAIIGGFDSTSNVRAARDFGVAAVGTMAHSFIQSHDDELTAFRDFAAGRPDDTILLVDTYDTLKSGIPNAITVAKEMEAKGKRLKGVRLDSGDLAYLSKQTRKMLDEAGLQYVAITASNQLDEHVIKSLLEQRSPIDAFGVGTNLVTGHPDGALDGVYKLCYADGKPRIKISEALKKVTLPHKKQVWRVLDSQGNFFGADAVSLLDEDAIGRMNHPFEVGKSLLLDGMKKEPLLIPVMKKGRTVIAQKTVKEISSYSRERLALLPDEYKRFQNPHTYKVGITDKLMQLRDALKAEHKK